MYLLYEHESDSKLSVQALNNTELNGSRWVNISIQCFGSIELIRIPWNPATRIILRISNVRPSSLNPEPRSKKF